MIIDSFDEKSKAIITPELFYGKHDKVADVCVVTFSKRVANYVHKEFQCTEVAQIGACNGNIPIYTLEYKGKTIAFYTTMIGSAGAATCIEEAHCLCGAEKYVMFGSCGSLDRKITYGKLIVPTEAYRDEGMSYHYAAPADYIKIKTANELAGMFDEMKIQYVFGKTWTTDAIYRETCDNMNKRKAEGCIAVEMECAGAQAVCDYNGLSYYDFLISGDLLDSPEWDRRILGHDHEKEIQCKCFYIALEVAIRV